jgi:hypothetical protein
MEPGVRTPLGGAVAMSMIFPGMDPYLEKPAFWPGVHNRFVVYLADRLTPMLGRRYIATIEARIYYERPDHSNVPDVLLLERAKRRRPTRAPRGDAVAVAEDDAPVILRVDPIEVSESYIAIHDRESGLKIVTVIELVSPANKGRGQGRGSYLAKQRQVLRSDAHLVEIDLLRKGRHVLAVPEGMLRRQADYDYLISVNRAREDRGEFELYPRGLRQRLPHIRIPLAGNDLDVQPDLQAVLAQTYEAGRYRDLIRYDRPCVPALHPDDQAWADELIRAAAGQK